MTQLLSNSPSKRLSPNTGLKKIVKIYAVQKCFPLKKACTITGIRPRLVFQFVGFNNWTTSQRRRMQLPAVLQTVVQFCTIGNLLCLVFEYSVICDNTSCKFLLWFGLYHFWNPWVTIVCWKQSSARLRSSLSGQGGINCGFGSQRKFFIFVGSLQKLQFFNVSWQNCLTFWKYRNAC